MDALSAWQILSTLAVCGVFGLLVGLGMRSTQTESHTAAAVFFAGAAFTLPLAIAHSIALLT